MSAEVFTIDSFLPLDGLLVVKIGWIKYPYQIYIHFAPLLTRDGTLHLFLHLIVSEWVWRLSPPPTRSPNTTLTGGIRTPSAVTRQGTEGPLPTASLILPQQENQDDCLLLPEGAWLVTCPLHLVNNTPPARE